MAWDQHTDAVDEVVGALGDARRRHALYYLRERDAVDVETLAGVVAGWEAVGHDDGTAARRDHDRLQTALYHSDLPKLDDAGLVTFDPVAGTVESDVSGLADELLDCLFDHERFPPDGDEHRTERGDAG
jgi:hypothetical protein